MLLCGSDTKVFQTNSEVVYFHIIDSKIAKFLYIMNRMFFLKLFCTRDFSTSSKHDITYPVL